MEIISCVKCRILHFDDWRLLSCRLLTTAIMNCCWFLDMERNNMWLSTN